MLPIYTVYLAKWINAVADETTDLECQRNFDLTARRVDDGQGRSCQSIVPFSKTAETV